MSVQFLAPTAYIKVTRLPTAQRAVDRSGLPHGLCDENQPISGFSFPMQCQWADRFIEILNGLILTQARQDDLIQNEFFSAIESCSNGKVAIVAKDHDVRSSFRNQE